ncbi:hypothetical protein FQN49_007255, partial [Arthroderma sp. PD_2]
MHSPHDTSLNREGEMNEGPQPLHIDTSSVEYDYLSRSPLLEHDHGLSSSGLPRIRQRPSSRAPSLPFTLTPSPASQSQTLPRSQTYNSKPTPIQPAYLPDGATSPGVEDLYRFPSESLHSFSFAKQSDDLLSNRQNVLKRSIDFLKDRIGLAASDSGQGDGQAQMNDENEIQWMMDILSRSNLLGNYDGSHPSAGPATGPPELEGSGNLFDRAFGAYQTYSPAEIRPQLDRFVTKEQHLSPVSFDRSMPRSRGRKSAPSSRRVSLKRTFTDIGSLSQQNKPMGTLTEPYSAVEFPSNRSTSSFGFGCMAPSMHVHSGKSSPPTQAVFTTAAKPKWTVLAANDLACLIFGVTQSEFRKISILDLIQRERREWLESKLQ